MARPRKADAINADGFLGIRIPKALKKAIKVRARKHKRTLAVEVRAMLERALKEREGNATVTERESLCD